MRYRTGMKMDKRTEYLSAAANILLALAFVGIAMCCIAPDKVVGYIGISLVAIGFLGAISFDSMAQLSIQENFRREENKMKYKAKLDVMKEVSYPFSAFVADNGCRLSEFVELYDSLGWNFEKLYEFYQFCAGDEVIQTRDQVKAIIRHERRKRIETT